jgi:hypothetical protein
LEERESKHHRATISQHQHNFLGQSTTSTHNSPTEQLPWKPPYLSAGTFAFQSSNPKSLSQLYTQQQQYFRSTPNISTISGIPPAATSLEYQSKLSPTTYKQILPEKLHKREPLWDKARLTPPNKSKRRRLAHRRKKRNLKSYLTKKEKEHNHITKQTLHFTKIRCSKQYGFYAEPENNLQRNFNINIKKSPSELYTLPNNLTFHNLCKENELPAGTRQLLGLNRKFCIATSHINNNITQTMLKLARSIRTNYFLKQNNLSDGNICEKQIYICNKQWHPPPAPPEIEESLTVFEKLLKKKHLEYTTRNKGFNLINLTPRQRAILNQLRCNENIIIKPTDKNLGPAVMDKKSYIEKILQEHLLTTTYRQLSSTEANDILESTKTTLKDVINSNQDKLSTPESLYFYRAFKGRYRIPLFYGLPKVHKQPIP